MSSHRCKVTCIVTNFLVFWSICLSSYLVYFKKGVVYLTRETGLAFIPLMRFLEQIWGSKSFLVRLTHSFLFWPSSPLVWWFLLTIFPNTCKCPSLPQAFKCILDFVVLFFDWFSFPSFPYLQGAFFYAKLYSYIQAKYSLSLYR